MGGKRIGDRKGDAGMRKLWRRLRPYRRAAADLLILVGVLAALSVSVGALNFWLTDAARDKTSPSEISRIREVVGIVQGIAAALLIVVGGVFAYRKLQLFRDFEPHLTITQSVASRAVGTQYAHISVIATLRNSSKVKVEIRNGFFRIHQIQPLGDDVVANLYEQALNADDPQYISWPLMDEVHRQFGPSELVVEPGASYHEPCEFIISREVKSVLVYSYFCNPAYAPGSRSAQGWTATTFYDIVLESSTTDEQQEEDHATRR